MADERFHLFTPVPLGHLLASVGYFLVSPTLAELLSEACPGQMELRRTEIVQMVTCEKFGVYFELNPHDEVTPQTVREVETSGLHLWHFARRYLFVTPTLAELIMMRGLNGFSFSEGFRNFG